MEHEEENAKFEWWYALKILGVIGKTHPHTEAAHVIWPLVNESLVSEASQKPIARVEARYFYSAIGLMTSRSSEILEMEIVGHEVADRPPNSGTKSGYWDSVRHQETLRTRYGSGNSQDNAIEVVEFSGLEGVIEVLFFHPTNLFARDYSRLHRICRRHGLQIHRLCNGDNRNCAERFGGKKMVKAKAESLSGA
jgi:hypothetical protein